MTCRYLRKPLVVPVAGAFHLPGLHRLSGGRWMAIFQISFAIDMLRGSSLFSMDRSVGNGWPIFRTASRLGCRWPRRGRDGTARSRLRLEGIRTVAVARARTPRCEVPGLRLRVGNSQRTQQSSQQGASTPRPRIAAPNGACEPIPVQLRESFGVRACAGVGTGNLLGLLSTRNDPRGPCIAASFTH